MRAIKKLDAAKAAALAFESITRITEQGQHMRPREISTGFDSRSVEQRGELPREAVDLYIAKNHFGPIVRLKLTFTPAYLRFSASS